MPHTRACLVTGCAGFVGSHLVQALLDLGLGVVGVDNLFSGHEQNMARFRNHPDFSFYNRNINTHDFLPGLARDHPGLDLVFHLAAVVSVPYSLEHPDLTMAVNWTATRDMHLAARDLGLSDFIFAGSAAEYGDDPRLPLSEDCAGPDTVHHSPYGRSKYLASAHIANTGFGKSLRFFNIYGQRQDPGSPYSGVISKFMEQAVSGLAPVVHGDGLQTRDFIYVADGVRAYLAAAGLIPGLTTPGPGVYNIGTGIKTSILELAKMVRDMAGIDAPVQFAPTRPGDIRHSLADPSLFQQACGFTPSTPLDKGLEATFDWYRNQNAD